MAASMPGPTAPPTLDLDDRGLSWHREGASFVVERQPTLRAALGPLAFLACFGLLALAALRAGLGVPALLFGAVGLLGLAGFAVAMGQRVAIRAAPMGLHWEANLPRRSAGDWAGEAIKAARVRAGSEGAAWGVRREFVAEVRVRGEWVVLALGHSQARANDLVGGLCAALGVRREEPLLARPG